MATLLDLLWDLVERPDERAEYLLDPAGYVRAHGRADLTAEDVHAALDVVCDLVPAGLAAAIVGSRPEAPGLTLGADEAPIDRALLSLSHIVESLDGQPEAGPRPDPEDTAIDPAEIAAEPAVDAAPLRDLAPSDDTAPASDEEPSAEPAHAVFDPSALQIDGDPLRSHEAVEPVPAAADASPFDPAADAAPFDPTAILVGGDGESDMADVVPLSWDDDASTPEPAAAAAESPDADGTVNERVFAPEPPAPTLVPEGGFGTGGHDAPAADEQPATGDDQDDTDDDAPMTGRTNLFTKKSKMTLPTLGIDASDWYDEDEPE
jgi:hypothetical protein